MASAHASPCRGLFLAVLLASVFTCGTDAKDTRAATYAARICVGPDVDCDNLRRTSLGVLSCTQARDRLDCLKKMRDGEAEFGYFEAEDVNLAALSFSGRFEAVVKLSLPENEVRRVFMLVHNASNPNPRSLCHPGFNLQRFFPPALYRPPTPATKDMLLDVQSHIELLAKKWTSACIPGMWSQDPTTDRQLKRLYSHLCSACPGQNCDGADTYAGSGALTCLFDRVADAAVVSDVDFRRARDVNPQVKDLYHFCRVGNGSVQPLGPTTVDDREPCDWGQRPPSVLLTPPCQKDSCQTLRDQWISGIIGHSESVAEILGLPASTKFEAMDTALSPARMIKNAGYKLDHSLIKNPVRFCVTNEAELAKCRDLQMAAQAYGVGANVGVDCVLDTNESHCYPDIYLGRADVIALDGGDVYQVRQDYGFDRLLSEVYNSGSDSTTSSYYAVAVVRAESNITYFSQLRGRKSCHTGIGKTSGWKMPVAMLLKERLIDPRHCNYINAVAEFFTGGSCAPGAKSSKYNPNGNYVESLCRLCRGGTDTHCVRGTSEPFYSYSGAFRCLVQGGGDVAFVKHTTVPDHTDGHSTASWTVGLRSDQFKLLCSTGDRAAVTEYKTCNLAMVPAHEVVVSGRMREPRKAQVRDVLLSVSKAFGSDAPGSKTFSLFGKYQGKPDLLFKDSAVGLKALTEDTTEERRNKDDYFKKLDELHSCEIRVCALEDEMEDCEAMVADMWAEGYRFVCASARDRLDCMRRVKLGQVDMSPLTGRYLGLDNFRVFAVMRDPAFAADEFRYKAVTVVRRSRVAKISDLRGTKSCHTGYGRTTGWRIPVALLKREGVISPPCDPHQSGLEHEIASVATTFNRACVPGDWATSESFDAALKNKYSSMCSMCRSKRCDKNDEYAGYTGALRCLTEGGADVAFSKLSVVQDFFRDSRAFNSEDYGLLCRDDRVVSIFSSEADECFWAARPWDAYVTSVDASDSKAQKLFSALTQARLKGEENLKARKWYSSTLGIKQNLQDIFPILVNVTTREFYGKTQMNIVEAEEMCPEKPVRLCTIQADELSKCTDLQAVLKLRGVSPPLQCVMGTTLNDCLNLITRNKADIMTLTDKQRFNKQQAYNLVSLLSENYGQAKDSLYYLLAVVSKSSGINSTSDLAGKTSCQKSGNGTTADEIDAELKECLSGSSKFFESFRDAYVCLSLGHKDVAFVKYPATEPTDTDQLDIFNSDDYQLLCPNGVAPVHEDHLKECNLGRIPANVIVTRQTETGASKENMRHLMLTAAQNFGKSDSFFRLFYEYFSSKDLLFKDQTTDLSVLSDEHYQTEVLNMFSMACDLYSHHIRTSSWLNT